MYKSFFGFMLCTFKMNEYFYAVAKPYLKKT